MTTTITLTPELEAKLAALVAAGEFDSLQVAAQALLEKWLQMQKAPSGENRE